jgi:two-component system, NtrC family, nitrogen regulation sensor histidine kinase NtrY
MRSPGCWRRGGASGGQTGPVTLGAVPAHGAARHRLCKMSGAGSASRQKDGKGFYLSLVTRLSTLLGALLAMGILFALGLNQLMPDSVGVVFGICLICMMPISIIGIRVQFRPILSMFRTLEGTVTSYKEGDFSFSLHRQQNDELTDLIAAHNVLGNVLREQRLNLIQRELMFDTMLQNTPVAMLLVAEGVASGRAILYANPAARQLLNQGHKLEGHQLGDILSRSSIALRDAMARGGDGLFTTGDGDDEEVYHLARRNFSLNGRRHELLLLRQLTVELRRQEVQTWKKVIRVISHELNNSLAPLASLANSGAELVRRGQTERLPLILETIEERTRHLERFILGYARFAKLPMPRIEACRWEGLLAQLLSQVQFRLVEEVPPEPAFVDPAQIEQALLNLLKNAHESGSAPDQIELHIKRTQDVVRINVMDRGQGMNDAVLTNALVPFYSTKRSGTGLGLALAREIAEAHGGRITLSNRLGGGLMVTLALLATTGQGAS